ncbi:glutathione synthase [Methylovorus sp. MM2]|uniref:glutathione synthase n=1 Tax=Methylovorus sp. MM2 TaxID=1848038 RepID=UPI0007DFFE44|nr:glutathione synthase [Methylovorus sp. MM2]OAM52130.1 glutathione synthase [Methylovorus sp. MM2]
MRIVFILDPLDKLKTYKDTSLAIMREASKRGHALFIAMQGDVILRNEKVCLITQAFTFSDGDTWYKLAEKSEGSPSEFDAIIMRKDPPFDNEYLYSTYLLSLAVKQGAKVFNSPDSIRSWNEKLGITHFPKFAPEFLVTRNNELIRDFLKEYGDIVVKPLDGMGGSSIFRLRHDDPNISVILETITNFEHQTIMAQRYLPEIKQGDKRIILINGDPIPYALARIPKAGETRGNLAAGGTGVAQKLTERDVEIAAAVGKEMKAHGLFLVGLDVIGEHLTEVNVTSPTGMVEIAKQTEFDPASQFIDKLEHALNTDK